MMYIVVNMKLNYIDIKNFRSLHKVRIDMDPPCRILVGINESGKSNILKALALLSDNFNPQKKNDCREALPNEDPIRESYVRFTFKFEKNETDQIFEIILSRILAKTKNPEIISAGGTKQSLKKICTAFNEAFYTVNILTEQKTVGYRKFGSNYKLLHGWKKPTSTCPQDYSVDIKGQLHLLTKYALIQSIDIPNIPEKYLQNATIDDLMMIILDAVVTITRENLPKTLFWEYNEDNLLPQSVSIANFANKPDSCPPLRNMFALADIDDIKASIEDARKGTDNQFRNYLDRVANKTTEHFQSIWKEYGNIEFSLSRNADQINPGVKERNIHDFARRSDGFKRFVTFLLMISANVRTHALHDTLLLIDDPDVGLHPSSKRCLRDELIKISETNHVVYSTHSIFMIDPGDIARHYIVRKEDEITSIEPAKESNIADEEVLYNALGYSVFEILREKNLIFEGWRDKRLFKVALEDAPVDLKEKFENVGVCHAKGVGTIKTITSMIELARRECLIISDNDKPAKEQQKIYKQEKGFGTWKRYHDIDSSIEAITGEDFIENVFIAEQVNHVLADSGLSMPEFKETFLPSNNKLSAINKWLKDNGMTVEQSASTITKVKNSIFENLSPQNIEATYTKLLSGISL